MQELLAKITQTVEHIGVLEHLIGEQGIEMRAPSKEQRYDHRYRYSKKTKRAQISVGIHIDDVGPRDPNQWDVCANFSLEAGNGVFIDVTWQKKNGWEIHCNLDLNEDQKADLSSVPERLHPLVKKHGLELFKPKLCSRQKALALVKDSLDYYRTLKHS